MKAIGNIFTGPPKPKKPKFPALPEPAVMPTEDDDQVKKATNQAIQERQQASGRYSTILDDSNMLGVT